jgi:hypothetical protein
MDRLVQGKDKQVIMKVLLTYIAESIDLIGSQQLK